MKKRALFYLVALVSIVSVSLQSCATNNYVVSKSATYAKDYKKDSRIASSIDIDNKKMEQDKQQLIGSFFAENQKSIANTKKDVKDSETTKAAKYSKTIIDSILKEAETYLGTPYRYGGTTRNGIDCSAFVLSVFGTAAGLKLPRVAAFQAQEGEKVEKGELQKGDLIFFSHGRRISHVGIIESISEEGEVKFIHAATSKGVMISSLNDSYWGPKYRFAKRVINKEERETYNNLFAT